MTGNALSEGEVREGNASWTGAEFGFGGVREGNMSGTRQALSEGGLRVLNASRTELYVDMRFIGPALSALNFEMDLSTASVGTDAVSIRFNPSYVLRLFVEEPAKLNRTYVHMLLHCIFRHMYTSAKYEDTRLYDLCADIVVESILDGMDYRSIYRVSSDFRDRWIALLEKELKVLTVERLYRFLSDSNVLSDEREYEKLEREFKLDDHGFWLRIQDTPSDERDSDSDEKEKPRIDSPMSSDENEGEQHGQDKNPETDSDADGGAGQSKSSDKEKTQMDSTMSSDEDTDRQNDGSKDSSSERKLEDRKNSRNSKRDRDNDDASRREPPADNKKTSYRNPRRLKQIKDSDANWDKEAKRLQTEIETLGNRASDKLGKLSWILRIQNKKRHSYKDFLQRFMVLREEGGIDMDSFDYGMYAFGLTTYGNMPLIEEYEFREVKKVQELVIAIDTSASCKGEIVQRFLDETASILLGSDSFFRKIKIYLIECDDQVQRTEIINSVDDMKELSKEIHVEGGFGTDFRPVFEEVERLRREGEFENLKGLIYFTDGYGIYPEKPTPYDTAFLFAEDGDYDDENVPAWALKLYV